MAVQGLPRFASRLQAGNPLLEGIVTSGEVELAPGLVIEVGASFVWWRPEPRRGRELGRIVGAAPAGALPARVVLVLWVGDRPHEVVAFASEVEVWTAPQRGAGARAQLRRFVGDPLR